MTENHPITPPPELVEQWDSECESDIDAAMYLATQAARWGADQELEACCAYISRWFVTPEYHVAELRAARRPNPPSLKEQALAVLDDAHRGDLGHDEMAIIRRALESLPDNQ